MEEELLMSTPTTITTTKRKVIECVFEENNDSSDTIVHMEKKRRIAPPRIESMGLLPLPPVNGLFHISPFEQEELGGVPTFDIFLNCFFHLGWDTLVKLKQVSKTFNTYVDRLVEATCRLNVNSDIIDYEGLINYMKKYPNLGLVKLGSPQLTKRSATGVINSCRDEGIKKLFNQILEQKKIRSLTISFLDTQTPNDNPLASRSTTLDLPKLETLCYRTIKWDHNIFYTLFSNFISLTELCIQVARDSIDSYALGMLSYLTNLKTLRLTDCSTPRGVKMGKPTPVTPSWRHFSRSTLQGMACTLERLPHLELLDLYWVSRYQNMPITQKMSDNLKTYTNAYMSNVTGCHPSVSCINISAPGLYELHSKYKSPDDLNFPSLYILSVNGKIADFDHSKIRYFTVPFIPPMYISAYTKLKKLICLAWEFVECNKFLRLTLPYLPSLEYLSASCSISHTYTYLPNLAEECVALGDMLDKCPNIKRIELHIMCKGHESEIYELERVLKERCTSSTVMNLHWRDDKMTVFIEK